MQPEQLDAGDVSTQKGASLHRVLRRSQKIRATVKRAAARLASATAVLKRGKKANIPPHSVERAITTYEKVESDVVNAADGLARVNADLTVHVAERVGLESELAGVKAELASAQDELSESQASEHEALHLALHDPLTGLPNRALFDQGLEHGLMQARRHGWRLAVLFIDVDGFKEINDAYGHHVGDEVLLMIASRLRSFVRAEDIVSRWGGDEFACLLLEAGQEADVIRLARGMCDHIADEFEAGGTTLSLKCSIGIAIYPGNGRSAYVLLKNADEAMYRAKGTPECVVLYGSQPEAG